MINGLPFYAGSSTISIVITPDSCLNTGGNQGIQAGIYGVCDETGGTNEDGLASDPIVVQCPCTLAPIDLSSNDFVIGQIYYMVIDGCGADICSYEIEVVEGITSHEEISEQIENIYGDTTFCVGDIASFSVGLIENATLYNWTVGAGGSIYSGQGTNEIEVEILDEGITEICVYAYNSCFTGEEFCLTFSGEGEIQTTDLVESICEGDSILFGGDYYTDSGSYTAIYSGMNNCDSIITLDLTVNQTYENQIDTLLEPGGTYNGVLYETDTTIVENYFTENGCDSLVVINIMVQLDGIYLPIGLDKLNIYPNPTSNHFFLQLEISDIVELEIDSYNTLGKKINCIFPQSTLSKGVHEIKLDASHLANGAYFLHFKTGKGNFVKRLVVAR